jgi:hypothetical protein
MKRVAILVGLALVLAAPATSAPKASSFRNCTALNKVYRHGVGRFGARDHTSSTPVTNFKHSNRLYRANPRARSRQGRHRLREKVTAA